MNFFGEGARAVLAPNSKCIQVIMTAVSIFVKKRKLHSGRKVRGEPQYSFGRFGVATFSRLLSFLFFSCHRPQTKHSQRSIPNEACSFFPTTVRPHGPAGAGGDLRLENRPMLRWPVPRPHGHRGRANPPADRIFCSCGVSIQSKVSVVLFLCVCDFCRLWPPFPGARRTAAGGGDDARAHAASPPLPVAHVARFRKHARALRGCLAAFFDSRFFKGREKVRILILNFLGGELFAPFYILCLLTFFTAGKSTGGLTSRGFSVGPQGGGIPARGAHPPGAGQPGGPAPPGISRDPRTCHRPAGQVVLFFFHITK